MKRPRPRLEDDEEPNVPNVHPTSPDHTAAGRFAPGNRAAVGRRAAGSRLRRALDRAASDEALDRVVASMIRKAQRGDVRAARLLLDRVGGRPRQEHDDERTSINVGELSSVASCAQAQQLVAQAAAAGEITLAQAQRMSWIIERTAARHVAAAGFDPDHVDSDYDDDSPPPEFLAEFI